MPWWSVLAEGTRRVRQPDWILHSPVVGGPVPVSSSLYVIEVGELEWPTPSHRQGVFFGGNASDWVALKNHWRALGAHWPWWRPEVFALLMDNLPDAQRNALCGPALAVGTCGLNDHAEWVFWQRSEQGWFRKTGEPGQWPLTLAKHNAPAHSSATPPQLEALHAASKSHLNNWALSAQARRLQAWAAEAAWPGIPGLGDWSNTAMLAPSPVLGWSAYRHALAVMYAAITECPLGQAWRTFSEWPVSAATLSAFSASTPWAAQAHHIHACLEGIPAVNQAAFTAHREPDVVQLGHWFSQMCPMHTGLAWGGALELQWPEDMSQPLSQPGTAVTHDGQCVSWLAGQPLGAALGPLMPPARPADTDEPDRWPSAGPIAQLSVFPDLARPLGTPPLSWQVWDRKARQWLLRFPTAGEATGEVAVNDQLARCNSPESGLVWEHRCPGGPTQHRGAFSLSAHAARNAQGEPGWQIAVQGTVALQWSGPWLEGKVRFGQSSLVWSVQVEGLEWALDEATWLAEHALGVGKSAPLAKQVWVLPVSFDSTQPAGDGVLSLIQSPALTVTAQLQLELTPSGHPKLSVCWGSEPFALQWSMVHPALGQSEGEVPVLPASPWLTGVGCHE